MAARHRLVVFLRIWSAVTALALPCALLPVSWMAAVHDWLGLGTFPPHPIVEYLARSTSLLYGMIGVVGLYLARDVGRNLDLIRFIASLTVIFGVALTVTCSAAKLPIWWTVAEGSTIIAGGVILHWLATKISISGKFEVK